MNDDFHLVSEAVGRAVAAWDGLDGGQRPMVRLNGQLHQLPEPSIDFAGLVSLAFPLEHRVQTMHTIIFRKGRVDRPEGFLAPGEVITVTTPMEFTVVAAVKS